MKELESLLEGPNLEELTRQITSLFTDTLAALVEQRDSRYENEIAGLESERATLAKEYGAIEQAAGNLKLVLPAMEREAERAADALTLAGKHEEARAKIAESGKARNAPLTMKTRQQAISARIETLRKEERDIARHIFNEWYREVQQVCRASEQGHFLILLDGLEQSFYDFQTRTDTALDRMNHPGEPGLVYSWHIAGLTADERSAEWKAARKWYGGRA